MNLYLIRHADPNYEKDSITAYGQRQAEALAELFEDKEIAEIYSSPLGRALATAKPLSEKLKKTIKILPWAAEAPFPAGTPPYILRGKECMDAGYEWYRTKPFADMPIAEMTTEIFNGLDTFLAEQGYVREGRLYKIQDPCEKNIVLFFHGVVGVTLLAHLFEIPINLAWANLELHTTGITKFWFQNYGSEYTAPRCMALNVRPHLWNVSEDSVCVK